MKILAISDLHGQLPDPANIPDCDVFIIAGDVCPVDNHERVYQKHWLSEHFNNWLLELPARHVLGIGGNHDFVLDSPGSFGHTLFWTYLQDSSVTIEGVNFYGIPWVPNLPRWAFHVNPQTMARKFQAVPKDTDIVISHGPPYGIGDLCSPKFGYTHVGEHQVNKMILKVKPKGVICGHIHESHGLYKYNQQDTYVCNVSYLDDNYDARYQVEDVSFLLDVQAD